MSAKNKILKKTNIFQGRVVNVDEYELQFDTAEKRTFEIINFNVETGVSALPIHHGKLLLIRHYQAAIDEVGFSLPTGGLSRGEDPEQRMQLELQEEIGFKAGSLSLMARMHTLPSYIGTEAGYLYLAEQLTPSKLAGDEPYQIEIIELDLDQALDLIQSGTIQDTRTITAILYYNQFHHQ